MHERSPSGTQPGVLHIGCPVWSVPSWVGLVYRSRDRGEWLREYSQAFSTVEGNSTFYGLPDVATTRRWAADTEAGFRFCWKVPRTISHDAALSDCETETEQLLDRLAILNSADRLGPTLLQLGPSFDATHGDRLRTWLARWPREFPLAVEVRHADWFDQATNERRLDQMLTEFQVARCLFDSRALFASPPQTPAETASRQRKPRSPYRTTLTHRTAMVRFIGRDNVELVEPWIEQWAETIGGWLQTGITVFLFTHAPDDHFAPDFARRMIERVKAHGAEPIRDQPWPAETMLKQRELF